MNNQDQLHNLRHSCSHLLAAAVLKLFPDALPTIGPATENGFYYDFDFGNASVSEADLAKIEKEMHHIVKNWQEFSKIDSSLEDAQKKLADNPYKLELIAEFASEGQDITFYQAGDFIDLCKGGHIDSGSQIKHFKLLSVAGAYWRGSEKNKMLTRIYGTAFFTQEELDAYSEQLAEAKKRDHRKLGRELDLFIFSDLVGPGLPLWTPKGTILRQILDDFVWKLRQERGYARVEIPHITKKDLYEKSGHWEKFAEELFRITTREGHEFALKPMNCPHHTQIFARKQFSYRQMPQRYANTTMCYRDEQTGELNGLSRVRSFTQDDAHVFCRSSQVKEEVLKIWDIVDIFYQALDFKLKVRLSLSDPQEMDKYLGKVEDWQKAEEQMRSMAKERGVEYFEALGEAAFYGPKLDFMANDSLGREWQVATIQLDFNMPERFDLTCVNEQGEKERVVMIHAAIMGSIERFLSILIEHFAGKFPAWLSPVQVKILPIAERHIKTANRITGELENRGIRVEMEESSESLSKKIRTAQTEKVPFMAVIGDKEAESGMLAVRKRDGGEQILVSVEELVELLKKL